MSTGELKNWESEIEIEADYTIRFVTGVRHTAQGDG